MSRKFMPEDTHAYLKTGTGPKSLLTKKLFYIKDLFRDVLSSDPENCKTEFLGLKGARAL